MNLTEQRQILEMILSGDKRAREAAVATIVATEGSTYRRAGARLLVDGDGPILGNLSGGCLEGEMAVEAEKVLRGGTPQLIVYDLSADDEAIWGWGLGCNGVMEVFIEPATSWEQAAPSLAHALQEGRAVGVATVLASPSEELLGSRLVVDRSRSILSSSGNERWDEVSAPFVADVLSDRKHAIATIDGSKVFVEALVPPDVLAICGAGHDAVPVAALCSDLGFEVVIVDDRENFMTPERFPRADAFVKPEDLPRIQEQYPDASLHAIVMTHNYLRDLDLMTFLARVPWTYVGLLGPRKRFERLRADLKKKDAAGAGWMEGLHAPAGLDLGAEGPEEIAVAIAAELLAVRNNRRAGFLRERRRPIHG